MDNILVFDNQVFDYIINNSMPSILRGSGIFAGVIMLVFVGAKVVKSFIDPDSKIDPTTLVRPCLTLGAIVLYVPLVELLLIKPAELISSIFSGGNGSLNYLFTQVSGKIELVEQVFDFAPDGDSGSVSWWDIFGHLRRALMLVPMLIMAVIAEFIIKFVAYVAMVFILLRYIIQKSLYFVAGPIVLSLSLIPGNEGALRSWYQGFFSILLWIPIMHVLSVVTQAYRQIGEPNLTADPYLNLIISIGFQIVLIIMVFSVPKYSKMFINEASQWASSGVGSAVGNGAANVAKTGGRMLANKATGGAYGAARGAARIAKGGKK